MKKGGRCSCADCHGHGSQPVRLPASAAPSQCGSQPALYHNERRFEMVHAWGNGNTTNYDIDLEAMTSRNPDSGIVVAMWA